MILNAFAVPVYARISQIEVHKARPELRRPQIEIQRVMLEGHGTRLALQIPKDECQSPRLEIQRSRFERHKTRLELQGTRYKLQKTSVGVITRVA